MINNPNHIAKNSGVFALQNFRAHPAIDRARRMHARVLSAWTMDLLWIRQQQLHIPGYRDHTGDAIQPLAPQTLGMQSASLCFATPRPPRWADARKAA